MTERPGTWAVRQGRRCTEWGGQPRGGHTHRRADPQRRQRLDRRARQGRAVHGLGPASVIAADGLGSTVRHMLGARLPRHRYPQRLHPAEGKLSSALPVDGLYTRASSSVDAAAPVHRGLRDGGGRGRSGRVGLHRGRGLAPRRPRWRRRASGERPRSRTGVEDVRGDSAVGVRVRAAAPAGVLQPRNGGRTSRSLNSTSACPCGRRLPARVREMAGQRVGVL
jgi:hypothetical protein